MNNNATKQGLSALDIINPNAKISAWLGSLAASGVIDNKSLEDGLHRFGLKRSKAAWTLFLQRFSVIMGVLLFVAGLIFFMAWNWENFSRFAKFAIVEAVFIICGAYSVLRWPKKGSDSPGWDARIALLGAALSIGGMLALYGQIYQTGADAWELFRAWTIMVAVLAIPGRVTAFWFMLWLVGSTWLGLYLATIIDLNGWRWKSSIYSFALYMSLAQFAMLALNEAASRILSMRGISHDPGRWLSRIIGCAAIGSMAFLAFKYLASGHRDDVYTNLGMIYVLSLAACFIVYYRFIPELLFLALSIFSAVTFVCVKATDMLIKSSYAGTGTALMLGLMILGLTFGSLKLILLLRKKIRERAKKEAAETTESWRKEVWHSLGLFKSRASRQAELKGWLLEKGAATAEAINAFFAADEAEQDLQSPWYAKLFITAGVWIGSAISLGAFTFLVFDGLNTPQPLGVIGIILCGLAVHLGHGKKLSVQAFSQVLGVCGLLYAACLFDFAKDPTALLLALLFGLFWLLKPPFAARLGAFMGMLISVFVVLSDFSSRSASFETHFYIKTVIYILGLLWSAHFLVLMEGRASGGLGQGSSEWLKKRFNLSEAFGSSAYACMIFFAVLVFMGPEQLFNSSMSLLHFNAGTAIIFAALTGLLAWRYPAVRLPVIFLGLPLTVLAWFAPYLALGFGLLLLAFHTGKVAFLGAATAYLGCGVCVYYYNMNLSFLYKSLVLMGSGAFFLALGIILARISAKGKLQ